MAQPIIQLDLPTAWRGLPWGPVTLTLEGLNGKPLNLAGFNLHAGTATGVNLHPVVMDSVNGVITLSLTVAQTPLLVVGRYPYDITGLIYNSAYFQQPFYAGWFTCKDANSLQPDTLLP